MNTLIVALIVYSLVTTCYLFGMCLNKEENPIDHIGMNGILAFIIFAVIMGIIKVFIYFQ